MEWLGVLISALTFSTDCPFNQDRAGRFQLAQGNLPSSGCFVSVRDVEPESGDHLTYRSYGAYQGGMFMVFVSVPGVDEAKATGARVFYFFPRTQGPAVAKTETGQVTVTFVNQTTLTFEQTSPDPIALSEGQMQIEPISMEKQGGFHVTQAKGVWMDSGWALGHMPNQDFGAYSTIHRENKLSCKLGNGELFERFGTGELRLKFATDEEFYLFIDQRCGS